MSVLIFMVGWAIPTHMMFIVCGLFSAYSGRLGRDTNMLAPRNLIFVSATLVVILVMSGVVDFVIG